MLKKSEIIEIINKMSLKEKIGQLNQPHYGWKIWKKEGNDYKLSSEFKDFIDEYGGIGSVYGMLRTDPWTGINNDNGFTDGEQIKIINLVNDYIFNNTRLKIKPFITEECPHGHQSLYSESYPTNISIGASFDKKRYSKVLDELKKSLMTKGVNMALFSGLDIPFDKRWGRTEECFSEDPYIAYEFNSQIVNTMQRKNKIAVTLKHFVAYGCSVEGKNGLNSFIGDNELEEIHMVPFYGANEQKVKSIMVAYNEIDGTPCIVNSKILNQYLRKKIKYKGMLMADGFAIDSLMSKWINNENYIISSAINAGIDMSLWDKLFLKIENCVTKDLIDIKTIDERVKKVLEIKNSIGLFEWDDKKVSFYKEDKSVNKDMAISGAVLLKNNQILPFSCKNKKVAVIGDDVDDIYYQLGDYSSFQFQNHSTYKDGIIMLAKQLAWDIVFKKYSDDCDYSIYDHVIFFAGGNSKRNFDTDFDINGAVKKTSKQKSMTSGEGVDCHTLDLPINQLLCFKKINNSKIITILNMGKPMVITDLIDKSSAVLNMWYPGSRGGEALCEVLIGIKEPSGRLSHTFPRYSNLNTLRYNDKNISEYKYFDLTDNEELYRFGYGLGYGDECKLSNIKYRVLDDNNVEFKFKIKNNNLSKREETIMFYKKTRNSIITPRKKELIGFEKISLNPDQEIDISVLKKYRLKKYINLDKVRQFETNDFIIELGQNVYYL